MDRKRTEGQSAIEYLMTYGWMLLVVAVVGSTVFALAQDNSVKSISGFSGSNILVENFGVTSMNNLGLEIGDGSGDGVSISQINVSNPNSGNYVSKAFTGDVGIGVGNSINFDIPGISSSDSVSTLDIEIIYDTGELVALSQSGAITGNLDITGKNSFVGPRIQPNYVEIDYFESGNLNDYSVNEPSNSIVSATDEAAKTGELGVKFEGDDPTGVPSISSDSGLDNYPSQGDTFEYWFRGNFSSLNIETYFAFAQQGNSYDEDGGYLIYIDDNGVYLNLYDDQGNIDYLDSSEFDPKDDEWYNVVVDWEENGDIDLKVYNVYGDRKSSLSTTNNEWTEGGVYIAGFANRPFYIDIDDVIVRK